MSNKQTEQETHICKYCNAETWQSDDECYAKPKSSVEWLFQNMFEISQTLVTGNDTQYELMKKAYEQAKQMHKEEIMEANSVGYRDGIMYANGEDWMYQSSEHYYDENFGGK